MELGEFLFMTAQKVTDMVQQELEARGIPYSLRPLVMECVCKRIVTEAYDHLVAVRAKDAQESITNNKQQPADGKGSPGEAPEAVAHTASTEDFLASVKRNLGPTQILGAPRSGPQEEVKAK